MKTDIYDLPLWLCVGGGLRGARGGSRRRLSEHQTCKKTQPVQPPVAEIFDSCGNLDLEIMKKIANSLRRVWKLNICLEKLALLCVNYEKYGE